tara:strand:- start:532 stop:702 length:171 start_codon:yes stop_codon:yes gene_type:complete
MTVPSVLTSPKSWEPNLSLNISGGKTRLRLGFVLGIRKNLTYTVSVVKEDRERDRL